MPAGFFNNGSNTSTIVGADNVDFSGAANPSPQVTSNGQILIGSNSSPNIRVGTLTAGTGMTITNGPGTITLATTASLTDLHTARFIVASSTNGTGANFTTIASAIAAAQGTGINSTIFIQPGTYTENLTLVPGINLAAYTCDALTPNVTIVGKLSFSTAGTVSLSGITLQTNSDNFLAVTGSVASIVNLKNCYLNCSNNTGISFTSSSASAQISIFGCQGDIGTTGIALFSMSSAGLINFRSSTFTNSGGSSTANTISAGRFNSLWTLFTNPLTSSGTATVAVSIGTSIITSTQNVTAFTSGGSGVHTTALAIFASGTASAISISNTLTCTLLSVDSTNTNAITGAGTIAYSGICFSNTSNTINVTTQSVSGTLQGSKNTAPTAGMIGEQIRSAVAQASAVTLSNSIGANVTSISLTAGIWDVSAIGMFNGAVTGTASGVSISTTSATTGTVGDNYVTTPTVSASVDLGVVVPAYRLTLTGTTTVYLVAIAVFSGGTQKAYGRISATRVG